MPPPALLGAAFCGRGVAVGHLGGVLGTWAPLALPQLTGELLEVSGGRWAWRWDPKWHLQQSGPAWDPRWRRGVRGQLGAGSCPRGGCCIPQELSEDNVIPFFCCVGPCPYPPHVQCHQGSPSAPSTRPQRAQHEGAECDPSVPLQPLFRGSHQLPALGRRAALAPWPGISESGRTKRRAAGAEKPLLSALARRGRLSPGWI